MEITFLGGADEIGASCAIVDFEETRILVDCGCRMNAPPGEALPDFSLLEGWSSIAAVILTHSHADHIGALPCLEPYLEDDCPIIGTTATLALSRVMLNDAVRIEARHRRGDGVLPTFAPNSVPAVLKRFHAVRWGKATALGKGEVVATWFPAGHILGAGMIELRSPRRSVLFTGDLSVADQQSIPGAFAPAIRPDVLVIESTYGNRMHAHRPDQEDRIVEQVSRTLAAKGHVLFPTFALGRAQEVLLILGRAMRSGKLERIPVYADGLVRAVSKVYGAHPDDLSPNCRLLCEQGFDPIFPDDLPIRPVNDHGLRERIVNGGPAVVVASSGMLQGGASRFYASHWVGEPRNLIMITGYQDEESPGKALLNLASQKTDGPRYFSLGGVRTEVHCQVDCFSLSAHADNGELVALADKLKPEVVLPVHGSDESRQALARSLAALGASEVVIPKPGRRYSLEPDAAHRLRRPAVRRESPLTQWPPWDPQASRELDLAKFHEWVASLRPRVERITIEELAEVWKSPEPVGPDDWVLLRAAIYGPSQPYFVPNAKRPYLLRVTPPENIVADNERQRRASVEQATRLVREAFPSESGLRRFGFYPEEGELRLDFDFPLGAEQRYATRLARFEQEAGWKTEIALATRDEDLVDLAACWFEAIDRSGVAVDHDQREVQIFVPSSDDSVEAHDRADLFHKRTGYRLVATAANS